MKQRRHAARWLTSGAQGHWCRLEKANTIFYWSNHFRSKFGGVKHPDGNKISLFIPEKQCEFSLLEELFEQRTSKKVFSVANKEGLVYYTSFTCAMTGINRLHALFYAIF